MISKKELLTILKNAKHGEEKAISVYVKHLRAAIFWLDMDKDVAGKVREKLLILFKETEKHKKMVENLIDKIKKEEKDAF